MSEDLPEARLPNHNQYLIIPASTALWLQLVLILASVLLVLGIFTPMLTLTKFILFQNSFSIFSGVVELLDNQQFILFFIVSSFSILLPIIKISLLFRILSLKKYSSIKLNRHLLLMHDYGRWAMLDVMVVAVLIVTVKLGAIASIQVHYGLYVFGAAVLLIMLVTHQVVKLTQTSH